MEDSLKTTMIGFGSTFITGMGVLPDIVSVGVGMITCVYLVIKIGNELDKKKGKKWAYLAN